MNTFYLFHLCVYAWTLDFSYWLRLLAWSPNLECRPYIFDKLLCGKFMLRFQVLHFGKEEILVWLLLHSWYLKRKTKSLFDLLITASRFKIQEVLVTSPSVKPFFLLLLPSLVNVDLVLPKRNNHFLGLIFKLKVLDLKLVRVFIRIK